MRPDAGGPDPVSYALFVGILFGLVLGGGGMWLLASTAAGWCVQ